MSNKLAWHDLEWALRRCPRALLAAMKKHGDKVIVAGGYIRACICGDQVNDVDVFVGDAEFGKALALELVEGDEKRLHISPNAITLRGFGTPIQIITRWVFDSPSKCILSFDFTVARAAFWYDLEPGAWRSVVDERFYVDLASKRLIYCQPIRIEEAGGSCLRVLKFYQKGYRIPLNSMGAVIARLMSAVRIEDVRSFTDMDGWDEEKLAKVITGLLREVDPNIDPGHLAHLPSEEGDPKEETTQ